MKIVMNFTEKEIVVEESTNLEKLLNKLKDMLGKDFKSWKLCSKIEYKDNWWYRPYQWPEITYTDYKTFYCGDRKESTPNQYEIFCLTDN